MPDVYSSVNGYIMVGEDDGGDVLSIAALDNGVLCFKAGATYFINTSLGNDITQWSVNKIDPKRGVCSPYSVANTPRGVIGLSIDKENEVDLRLFTSTGSSSLGVRVKDILNTVNNLYYDEVVGEYHGGRFYLSFTDNVAGLSYNHKLLVLQFNDDFSKFGFTVDEAQISSFIPCFGTGDFGQMYAGKSDLGKLLRFETTSNDIIQRTSSDINTGTLTRLSESGSEEYPELVLAPASEFSGLFSATPIDSLTATIDSYSTIDDGIDHCGYITSDVLYINATALYKAFWTVALGTNGGSAIRLRTGATKASCLTASWSEWFTDNTGSDISGVSANVYIQYQLKISSDDLPDANTKIYRDDFIVKISAGLGSPEDYINFVLDTGKIDLGLKRQD